MKNSSRAPRTATKLSEPVCRQLNMYAIAAGAAGVSLLALVQPSEARIIYTRVHRVVGPNSQFDLDLNHDGIIDFVIRNAYHFASTPFYVQGRLWATFPGANAIEGTSSFIFHSAYALPAGPKIGPPKKFGGTMMEGESVAGGNIGRWEGATNRYLGVRFEDRGGRTHYGWARFTVRGGPASKIFAILTGYAYETIPDKGIIAGRTKEAADDPTAEDFGPGASVMSPLDISRPATLGLLAMGAHGLSIWRRESVGSLP